MKCPEHGLERFSIKIVKRFNMKNDVIVPKFRNRPTVGDLSCLLVGRNVDETHVKNYLNEYFRKKGLLEAVVRIKLKV